MGSLNSVAVTGVAMVTALGMDLAEQMNAIRQGRSGVQAWDFGYSKVGAPLPREAFDRWMERFPMSAGMQQLERKIARILRGASFSTRTAVMVAIEAMTNAGYSPFQDPDDDFGVVVCGHQMQTRHLMDNYDRFLLAPDRIDPLFGLTCMDTYVGSVISELFALKGPCVLVGAACASGNIALMTALDFIRAKRVSRVLVVAPPCEMHPLGLHSWVMLEAVTFQSFNQHPQIASRPFDRRREGFVPGESAAAVVLDGGPDARALARLSGAAANSSADRQTKPSEVMAAALMRSACRDAGVAPEAISAINAHATSTPLGDAVEAAAIHAVFGDDIAVQATKSMLGHSLSSAALVEAVVCVEQIKAGFLHPTINLDDSDVAPIDVVTGAARHGSIGHILSNAFGFGGLNAAAIFSAP
jgi:3-oxoacyl-(acyl-carrier-protein) synthase